MKVFSYRCYCDVKNNKAHKKNREGERQMRLFKNKN